MPRLSVRLAAFALALAMLSCAAPLAPPTIQPVATGVAMTLQALASSTAASNTNTAPAATPTPVNLLPHALYFLAADDAGLTQIFRLEANGGVVHQITFEPANVDSYDVSPKDGSIAYASDNQLFLVDAAGAGRRLLIDGGPVNDDTRWTNSVGVPVWSPDGRTLAYSHDGLNFLTLDSGATSRVLENQVDSSAGFPVVGKIYSPSAYSPDGTRLLINIGFYEGGTYGIYGVANGGLVQLARADGGTVCCHAELDS